MFNETTGCWQTLAHRDLRWTSEHNAVLYAFVEPSVRSTLSFEILYSVIQILPIPVLY